MSGLLSPAAALRELSDLGLAVAGAKLHTYVSGTPATDLATYSNSALTVPNTNPIIASAGGLFGPIYLTKGVAYKYVLTDASDVTIWTRDPVLVPADGYTDGSTIKAADGLVATPGLTFNSDPDTGIYLEGANALGVSTAGVKALGIDATQCIDSPTQPRCAATNAAQTIGTGAFTSLTFSAEDFNVGAVHNTAVNPSRMTVPAGGDGTYLILGYCDWAASAAGTMRLLRIFKNNTTEVIRAATLPSAALFPTTLVNALLNLVAGDYVELQGFQDTGGNTTTVGVAPSRFSFVKLW